MHVSKLLFTHQAETEKNFRIHLEMIMIIFLCFGRQLL